MMREMAVEVLREVDATLIPAGTKIKLQPGTPVMVTQSLGNAYTLYVHGNLVRVAGKDGDALGLVVMETPDVNNMEGSIEDKITALLKTCFDPEIPVNIFDLGLVYNVHVIPMGRDEYNVNVVMTLTAAGCGMGPVLVQEVEEKVRTIHGVIDMKVDLVFDPPWSRDMMTDVAKLQLGML